MDWAIPVQTLDEAVCISCCVNNLWKGMNKAFLPPPMSK